MHLLHPPLERFPVAEVERAGGITPHELVVSVAPGHLVHLLGAEPDHPVAAAPRERERDDAARDRSEAIEVVRRLCGEVVGEDEVVGLRRERGEEHLEVARLGHHADRGDLTADGDDRAGGPAHPEHGVRISGQALGEGVVRSELLVDARDHLAEQQAVARARELRDRAELHRGDRAEHLALGAGADREVDGLVVRVRGEQPPELAAHDDRHRERRAHAHVRR